MMEYKMRKKISEKNRFPHFDLLKEYWKIEELLSAELLFEDWSSNQYTMEEYVDKFGFATWNLRGTFFSTQEMREELGIQRLSIYSDTIDEEFALDFLQYAFNLIFRAVYLVKKAGSRFEEDIIKALIENIEELTRQLNTRFVLDENTDELFLIYDDEVSNIATDSYPEIKASLVEYKKIDNRGDLKRKAEILCTLSKRLEDEEKKLVSTEFKSLCTDTTFLLNKAGIRHSTTNDPISRATFDTMDPQELEMWYDRAYEMLLSCLVVCPYIDIKQEIKALRTSSK